MRYYFDVLPLHPRPEYLESLTSYLMRLAEYNSISSVDGLSALCFPRQDRRITREIADYMPPTFGDITKVGACGEEVLRTTTFFHLATKFGRSTLPQPMSRFLSGYVSSHLRYCPMCFMEQRIKYNLLIWRFTTITCCAKHKCQLLETCGHCGKLIPLFTSPFKLGSCPSCQQSLQLCRTTPVFDEIKLEIASQVYEVIVFLLTPYSWEASSSGIIRHLGQQLARLRQMKQLTAQEMAHQVGVTLTTIEGIERGNPRSRGAIFQNYIKYTQYFNLNLKEIFSEAMNAHNHTILSPLPLCPACQQNSYVIRCGYNRSGSQRYECHHCHRGFTASPKTRK